MKKIMGVVEVTEEDQKKYKKLAKAPDLGIKILFKKKAWCRFLTKVCLSK